MMCSDFRAAEPGEKGLGLIGASAVFAERDRMIDAAHFIVGMQRIPASRFIGMNNRAERHVPADRRDGIAFLAEHERQRAALALAHDDNDLALAGLFLRGAAIDALRDVFWLEWPPK